MEKSQNGEENAQLNLSNDGSICGYDSLHHLLKDNLKPHHFQEVNRLLTGLNCGKVLETIALPESATALSVKHGFDAQAFCFCAYKEQLREPRVVRVGLIQNSIAIPTTAHFVDQKKALFEKLEPIIDAAGSSGVNILCLQEAWMMPFAFCTREKRWCEFAEPADGESTKFLQSFAKKYNMVIISPILERDVNHGEVMWNTAVVIGNHGNIIGIHRKNHIPRVGDFNESTYYMEGNTGHPVFETAFGKIAINICYGKKSVRTVTLLNSLKMVDKSENGEENEQLKLSKYGDGSICGYNSLHHLLKENLKPHHFQEVNRLLTGLNCGKVLETIDLPESAKALSMEHGFDLQAFCFHADKEVLREPRVVRVGLIQNSIALPTTVHFIDQKKAIFEKVKPIVDAAGSSGVNILCLQEFWMMPFGFSTREKKWCEFAEPVDGESTEFLRSFALKYNMVIISPILERDMNHGEIIWNTAVVIGNHGNIIGIHRKNHVTRVGDFTESTYYMEGNTGHPVFETEFGKIAINICYGRHHPLNCLTFGLNGAEIVFNPCATVGELTEAMWPIEVNHALLEEIQQINPRIIDTVVDISNEDVDSTTAAAAAEWVHGTIVKCSFIPVSLSPSLKSQYASLQSPIQPLRLLVPPNYPNSSPIFIDKFPVESRKGNEDLSEKAKVKLSMSLCNFSQPMSLKDIAKTCDPTARGVISEYAQQFGGGTFSSKYGEWQEFTSWEDLLAA